MKFIKIFLITVLLFSTELVFADFATPAEFIKTIQQFSQEELGIPLIFDTAQETSQSAQPDTNYGLFVCPKTRFWPIAEDLDSLYVYSDTIYPDSLIKFYKQANYDIELRADALSEVANASGEEILPDLSKITAEKIEIIFHEGFHYYLIRNRVKDKNTITSRSLEEGAATIFGEMTARLFIEKYYSPKSRLLVEIKKSNKDFSRSYHQLNVLYGQLDSVYQDTLLPDAKKITKAKVLYHNFHRHFGNAGLTGRLLYAHYYFAFREIWQNSATPAAAVEKFISIIGFVNDDNF